MIKKYNQTVVILAFCASFTDFLISTPADIFYPRDRIIHIMISAFIFLVMAYIVDIINFEKDILKFTAISVFAIRLIIIAHRFSIYFRMFYGNNSIGIIVFTILIFIMAIKINDDNFSQIGGFYIIINLLILILFFLAISKTRAMNIYSLNNTFDFSYTKLLMLFDVLTISIVSSDKSSKWKNQKSFIMLSVTVFMIITLVQGLCIKGDLMYSLSPLQAVLQILSGNTIKRYDYIFNTIFVFNYLGVIILYAAAIKKLIKPETYFENN